MLLIAHLDIFIVCPVSKSLVNNHGLTVYDMLHGKYLDRVLWYHAKLNIANIYRNELSACCNHDGRASYDLQLKASYHSCLTPYRKIHKWKTKFQ